MRLTHYFFDRSVTNVDMLNRKELGGKPAQAVAIAQKWGPSIRTVLALLSPTAGRSEEQLFCASAAAAARKLCSNRVWAVDNQQLWIGNSCSSLVFVRPVRPTVSPGRLAILDEMVCTIPTLQFAQIFNTERVKASRKKLLTLYDAFSSNSYRRDSAGWLLEKSMHVQMSVPGRPFEIFSHDGVRGTMLPATTLLAGTVAALRDADAPSYWFPPVAIFPGIDGVLVNPGHVYVLQATTAARRGDPEGGLREIWKAFGPNNGARYAWHFVVVTDTRALASQHATQLAQELRELRLGGIQVKVWGCVVPVFR